jgi:DNA polymerase III alpha subunit
MSTNEEQILSKAVLKHGPEIIEYSVKDLNSISAYLSRVFEEKLDYPIPVDHINKENWFIPTEYRDMNIEEFLVNACPKENYDRLIKELELYRSHNMVPVLRAMKYIVDTLRKNNIVWGVGRGSSVASYVLFLLGVHKIDSVKYNLPIEEFFKEKING